MTYVHTNILARSRLVVASQEFEVREDVFSSVTTHEGTQTAGSTYYDVFLILSSFAMVGLARGQCAAEPRRKFDEA